MSRNAGKQPDKRRPWRKPGIFQINLPNSLLDGPANPVPSPIVTFCFPPPWDKFNWRVSVKLMQRTQSGMVNNPPSPPLPLRHTKLCICTTQCISLFFTEDIPMCLCTHSSVQHNHFLYSGMTKCSDLKRP